jgi:ribonuclease III
MKNFENLEKNLKIFFKNKSLLIESFCHRSFINENPNFPYPCNERLEFLGDAVLELITTDYIFKAFPEKSEGELTKIRASLVNSKILADVSKKLGFENYLLLSKGEEKSKGKAKERILANTFEAFLGALYLEFGLDFCKSFLEKNLLYLLPKILEKRMFEDPKTKFQELIQEKFKITPIYKVLKEFGPEHEKTFVVGLYIGENLISKGKGSSKQEAEKKAAQKGLEMEEKGLLNNLSF